MSSDMILGIDPGLTGALCFYSGGQGLIYDIPTIGKEVDAQALADLINATECTVYLERAQAMPKQGVSSTFKYGVCYGVIIGLIRARGHKLVTVPAAKWKRAMGISADKDKARQLAADLIPNLARHFKRKKDHNRAEAALLAYYGRGLEFPQIATKTELAERIAAE